MYDSRFVRAWRLYLAGSIAAFRGGHLQLFQILFTGSQKEPMFWTRDALYRRYGTECRGREARSREGPREGQMDACDVLIVGGGPAGSSCAWGLRSAGLDVAILDRQTFPRDKICGGWITPAGAERTWYRSLRLRARPHAAAHHRISNRMDRRTGARHRLPRDRKLWDSPARVRRLSFATVGRASDGGNRTRGACSAKKTDGW